MPSPKSTAPPQLALTKEEQDAEVQRHLADVHWADDMLDHRKLGKYAGRYIAVYNREVAGSGKDPIRLYKRVAKKHGIPDSRVIVHYVDPYDY